MEITNYTNARKNLKRIMDLACLNQEPTLIISKSTQVVIISKAKYDLLIKGASKC